MRIFLSVGEPSGDLHGANLVRELQRQQPGITLVGFGGPRMAAAGCELLADLTQLAVMWFWRALLNLPRFVRLLGAAHREFRARRPDAVVLIDYPGFNWWVARAAKRLDIPVFYYGAPQMWAWAPWRVRKLRRLVDQVFCKLPFEEAWFTQRGCRARYVGHPYFDEMERQSLDETFLADQSARPGPLITILPGSRTQEVLGNLPCFLRAAARLQRDVPGVRFAVAAFHEVHAAVARRLLAEHGDLPVEVHAGRTAELIHLADACLACSGSVSLELLYHEKPAVIHYRVSPAAYLGQRLLRRVKYITLVNLLACRDPFPADLSTYDPDAPGAEAVPFPEYLTFRDVAPQMAAHLRRWLRQAGQREACVEQLRAVKDRFARAGASREAAARMLSALADGQAVRSRTQAA